MPLAAEKAFRISSAFHKASHKLQLKSKTPFKQLIALRKPFGARLCDRLGNWHTDMPLAGEVKGLHKGKKSSSEARKTTNARIKGEKKASAKGLGSEQEATNVEGTGTKSRHHSSLQSRTGTPASKSSSPTYIEQSVHHELQIRRKELVDTLMSSVLACIEKKLDTYEEQCDCESSASNSESHCSSNGSMPQGVRKSAAGSKRQLREDDSDGNDNHDPDGGGRRDKQNKRTKRVTKEEELKIFACPYYKYDPERFKACRTCSAPSFKEIHRVKEHVLRKHQLGEQCLRCCQLFKTEEALRKHQRSSKACEVVKQRRNYSDGFDKDQAKKLSGRPRMSPEERWKHMYCTLFNMDLGSSEIPSPFHDFSGLQPASPVPQDKAQGKVMVKILRDNIVPMVRAVVESEVVRATSTVERDIKPRIEKELWNSVHNFFYTYQSIPPPPSETLAIDDQQGALQNGDFESLMSFLLPTFEPQDGFDLDFDSNNMDDEMTHGSLSMFSSSNHESSWDTNTSLSSVDELPMDKGGFKVHEQHQPLALPQHGSTRHLDDF